ncbi:hypothetical protein AAFO92_17235 [Roseovarius sp. CAU 1744]|uniref:hypothetical protein n=1 Tax=Roseovarius sp. CAU 1744 TaxID=3140368 RepID=UPI00325B97BE
MHKLGLGRKLFLIAPLLSFGCGEETTDSSQGFRESESTFCQELEQVINAGGNGFFGFRGKRIDDDEYDSALAFSDAEKCWIEEDSRSDWKLSCTLEYEAEERISYVRQRFTDIEYDIDQCLLPEGRFTYEDFGKKRQRFEKGITIERLVVWYDYQFDGDVSLRLRDRGRSELVIEIERES